MLRTLNACRSTIGLRAAGLLLLLGGLLCALPTLRGVSAQAPAVPPETNPQRVVIAQPDVDVTAQPDLRDGNVDAVDEPKTYDGQNFDWWRANLRTELKPELRAEALRAMGHFGANGYAEEATEIIIDVVASYEILERDADSNNIRVAASDAIGRIGPSATNALISALSSESRNARRFAVINLGKFTPNEAIVQALVAATHDSDPEVRRSAVCGLARDGVDGDLAVPALTAALTDEDDHVRTYAASTLGRFQSSASDAVPALIVATRDERHFVRMNALDALASIEPDPELILPTLTEALENENEGPDQQRFRHRCLQYLGRIGPAAKSAVPALIDAYSRVSASEQQSIIETLGRIGPDARDSLPLITRALQVEDERTRRAAAAALERITE